MSTSFDLFHKFLLPILLLATKNCILISLWYHNITKYISLFDWQTTYFRQLFVFFRNFRGVLKNIDSLSQCLVLWPEILHAPFLNWEEIFSQTSSKFLTEIRKSIRGIAINIYCCVLRVLRIINIKYEEGNVLLKCNTISPTDNFLFPDWSRKEVCLWLLSDVPTSLSG